ncbi:MAG: DEAD/DEAH box helicase, partial [Treponema sp.]|nr:DEAD/DEAH box helicase [Treponema sp.]
MSEATKDFFKLHSQIMEQFKAFSQSFVDIEDPQILKELKKYGNDKSMWPEPLIQFNPSYQEGAAFADLISEGLFDPRMDKIFTGFHLYKHQEEALRLGANGKDFTVTSGTGSGKSLTFLGTIINDVLKNNSEGVTGLIVYPMNALINSQTNEIEKYASNYKNQTGEDFPVTFRQYTGQENDTAREEIRKNPPHILLTNYMMLEYLLTRLSDDSVKQAIFKNLKYIAFDELHTYRGRQGADVAILIRRIKAECKNHITCMGTSATIASGGTAEERKAEVAKVASLFFGQKFETKQIIEESLKSISKGSKPFDGEVKSAIESFNSEIS